MVEAYMKRKPMLEAGETLRQITVATFGDWSGSSKNPKEAARQGNTLRKKYQQELIRTARGLGKFDEIPGVDVLKTSNDVRKWFGGHGIAA